MNAREVRIRKADLDADRDRVLAVLARNLPLAASVDRYNWLYMANPCGRSSVWLAEDAKTGEAVGTSAGHPKRVHVHGKVETALNLSDFAFDKPYRSLGPALKLLRATLEPMQKGEFAFSYDHPSDAMLAIYKRMGGQDVSKRERWVRLLKASPTLRKRWGDSLKTSLAGRASDAALRLRDLVTKKKTDVDVSLFRGACGDEFDRLDEELSRAHEVALVRTAETLRWRYVAATTARHEILAARRGNGLVGYLVFRTEPNDVIAVVDVVTVADPVVRTALMEGLVSLGHERKKSAIWATVLSGTPSAAVFAPLGFQVRDTCAGVCIYAPKAAQATVEALQNPRAWWTLEGDQDV